MTLPAPHTIIEILDRDGLDGRRRIQSLATGAEDARALGIVLTDAEHPRVRTTAASILAAMADPAALPALLSALFDPEPEVIAAAADAAGNSAAGHDLPENLRRSLGERLLALLTTPDRPRPVRTAAAYALGLCRYAPAVTALIATLDDEDPMVRWNAVEALSHIGGPEAAQALRQQADRERDPEVLRYLAAALRALG